MHGGYVHGRMVQLGRCQLASAAPWLEQPRPQDGLRAPRPQRWWVTRHQAKDSQIPGGLLQSSVTACPGFAKWFPILALWLTVSNVRVKRFKRWIRKQLATRNGNGTEVPDFDLNVFTPWLPKRSQVGKCSQTYKVWRKTVYWARRYDQARYGTMNRFDAMKDSHKKERVVVLGGGAFGTAMAAHIARNGLPVHIVLRDELVRDCINRRRVNPRYLSDFDLPPQLTATTNAAQALRGCTMLVAAMPVQVSRQALQAIKESVPYGIPVVGVSKGIELGTGQLMYHVVLEALGRADSENPFVVVSGPSFAKEIMDRRPTVVVAASKDSVALARVQNLFTSHYFRVSITHDVIGIEVAGALKNVLAIAAGICEGLDLGFNAMAALVMQGNAEIRWLAIAMGAKPETLCGPAGMGDILLTCFGSLSRNRCVGVRLGRGEPLESILSSSDGVAEGVYTARLVVELSVKYRVLLPLLTTVARILNNEVSPWKAVFEVMSVPPLPESA